MIIKNIFVYVDAANTVTTKTFPTSHDAFAACQNEWAAKRPAQYCDANHIEAAKAEVARRWTEGWKPSVAPSTAPIAAPAEQPKPIVTAKTNVRLAISFTASYDASHPDKAVAHWTVDLATVGGAKELTGTMSGADGAKVTDDTVTLTALLNGLRALKRPCEVDVVYPKKGKTLKTIEKMIERGFKTAAGKEPANLSLLKELAPLLEIHDCIFVMQ